MSGELVVDEDGSFQVDAIDVTDTIIVYEHGKTWDCTCGHGIGTEMNQEYVKCASCNNLLVDKKALERKPPKRPSGQQSLGAFL